jgi:hypothetical protein
MRLCWTFVVAKSPGGKVQSFAELAECGHRVRIEPTTDISKRVGCVRCTRELYPGSA